MADSLSLGDNKADNKITENVGKSPLEQSISSAVGHGEVARKAEGTPSPFGDEEGSQSKTEPEVAPVSQNTPPPAENTDGSQPGVDLPPGVESAPASSVNAPQATPPTMNNLDNDSPAPAVLQEKPQTSGDTVLQPSMSSGSSAALDPLEAEPEGSSLSQTNTQDTQAPKTEAPSVGQPKAEQDFGEPSKAPDTDEFLKSILDDKTGMPGGSTPQGEPVVVPTQPGQAPVSPPVEPQPSSNDFSNELGAINSQDALNHNGTLEPNPLSEKSPIDGQSVEANQGEKQSVSGVGIDSISGKEPPTAEGDDMVNAKRPKPKTGSIKIVLAVVLAALVVAIGYYVYTLLFPAQDDMYQSSVSEIPEEIDYSVGLEDTAYVTDDEQRKADLAQIKSALLDYFAGQGSFPVAESLTLLSAGNILETELVPTHLSILPADPSVSKSYGYKSNGSTFTLSAILDDSSDAEAVIEGGQAIYSLVYDPSEATVSASATPTTAGSTSDIDYETGPTGDDTLSSDLY